MDVRGLSASTHLLEVQLMQDVCLCGALQGLQRFFDRAAEFLPELSSAQFRFGVSQNDNSR